MERVENEPYYITFEIENRDCKGLKVLKDAGVTEFTLVDVREVADGTTRHLIRLPATQTHKLPSRLSISDQVSGRPLLSFDSDGCTICGTILTHNSFLISARSVQGTDTIVYSFVAPSFHAFQIIVSDLEKAGFETLIRQVTKFQPQGTILTEHQERVLWYAFQLGFFDYPRKINTIALSKKLGIVPSTLSEVTRRGLRRLLADFFN
jgi:predicted DNA binding protein